MNTVVWIVASVVAGLYVLVGVCLVGRLVLGVRRARSRMTAYRRLRHQAVRRPSTRELSD